MSERTLSAEPETQRLNKVLAQAGVASRRAADRLIRDGRVLVNGKTVEELGTRVDPCRDVVRVDGKRIGSAPKTASYWMLHKPRGYLTTLSDPEGRPTIRKLMSRIGPRVFPVGRLDYHSEGLLLLTDDGDLARDLMHPSHDVPKTYSVKVRGEPGARELKRLRDGVLLDRKRARAAEVRLVRPGPNSWVEITVAEGRYRQVRRMFQAVGHRVLKLKRVRYAGLTLGKLPSGGVRRLTPEEVDRLRRAVHRGARRRPPRRVVEPS